MGRQVGSRHYGRREWKGDALLLGDERFGKKTIKVWPTFKHRNIIFYKKNKNKIQRQEY